MKAFIRTRYGGPEVLSLSDEPKPVPGPGQVLIKVLAASVNPSDWHVMRGRPLFSRATLGLFGPKHRILGTDVAGTVEAIGSGVTAFRPGDEVMANLLDRTFGGFAEYVVTSADVVARKPKNLSFEEASAVPMAAVTALEGLRHHGAFRAGQSVLVNGASGGVGHFAVQIAKAWGAVVTGVTSTGNLDLVRSLGADHVIDYKRADFTAGPNVPGATRGYDLVLDTIGNRPVADLRRALAPGGKAAVTGFTNMRNLLGAAFRGGKNIKQVQAHANTANLDLLTGLIEAGKVRPVIDRRYPFAELPAAVGYLEAGRVRGKVVVGV